MNSSTTGTAQPSRVAGSIERATINRGTDITQSLAVNSHLAPPPATEVQVQQARIAQDNAPARAKVVTDSESVKPVLQEPLTSLKPITRQGIPSSTFDTTPATTFSTERAPSTPVVTPAVRTYPQTDEEGGTPSRVYYPPGTVYPSSPSTYQPHSTATGTGGGSESHSYVQPAVHPGTSGNSGGGQVNRSSGGNSGAGSGGYHGGGANGGSYQQGH
jgi:hypothetical protein